MPGDAASAAGRSPQPIGIAVVAHCGRVLVGVRGPGGPLPGHAEFPGGKCEPGEAPDRCAVRECAEETGLLVTPLRLLADYVWAYPHAMVHLHFVLCRPLRDVDVQATHCGYRWAPVEELSQLSFPEANGRVLPLAAAAAAQPPVDHGNLPPA